MESVDFSRVIENLGEKSNGYSFIAELGKYLPDIEAVKVAVMRIFGKRAFITDDGSFNLGIANQYIVDARIPGDH